MEAAQQLSKHVGVRQACQTLGVPRASFYRRRQGPKVTGDRLARRSSRALSVEERQQVKDALYSERFLDKAPREVFAALLDEGEYLCSVRVPRGADPEAVLQGRTPTATIFIRSETDR